MRIVGVIPARGGSKGIPRKNLARLGGRPLISWTISAARSAVGIDRLIVSTDDDEIADVALAEGAEVPFRRPAEFSSDTASAVDVIRHALIELENDGFYPEVVVYLQPTSPFRRPASIEKAISLMVEGSADTVVSVVRVPHNMSPVSLMRSSGGCLEFVAPPEDRIFRRQDKEILLARNGPAVLAMTRHVVINEGKLYGRRIKAIEMGPIESHDIDEPLDLEIAEALLPLACAELEYNEVSVAARTSDEPAR